MVLVVRDFLTDILENVEHLTGIVPGFPPDFSKAQKVKGYNWEWEVPTDEAIWRYGLTNSEFRRLKTC